MHEVAPDIAYKRLLMVNVAYLGAPAAGDQSWVLVDAGLPGIAGAIVRAAAHRFGENARPAAIIMTHGHFDHVGALATLADRWKVPIFAHELELPYLDGRASYPPADPTVGGGMMATLSPLYPRGPIDVSEHLQPLPADGTVPFLPEWRWIATPGHAPGHISLSRERDRALVVGDAFITTNQESAYGVATQELELHGPPRYFTPDWTSARESVRATRRARAGARRHGARTRDARPGDARSAPPPRARLRSHRGSRAWPLRAPMPRARATRGLSI